MGAIRPQGKRRLGRRPCPDRSTSSRIAKVSGTMATLNYIVPGVTCGHCKSAIETGVGHVQGVTRVDVDIETKRVMVEGEASDHDVVAAIAEAGYDEVQHA
jgi:copper chaperone